mgnify:CR=1 FL=1
MHTDNGQRIRGGQRNKPGRGSICESSGPGLTGRGESNGSMQGMTSNHWTKAQVKLGFNLYCQLPFGMRGEPYMSP